MKYKKDSLEMKRISVRIRRKGFNKQFALQVIIVLADFQMKNDYEIVFCNAFLLHEIISYSRFLLLFTIVMLAHTLKRSPEPGKEKLHWTLVNCHRPQGGRQGKIAML